MLVAHLSPQRGAGEHPDEDHCGYECLLPSLKVPDATQLRRDDAQQHHLNGVSHLSNDQLSLSREFETKHLTKHSSDFALYWWNESSDFGDGELLD